MRIGVDGNEANVEHKVGVSVYTAQLLDYFKKQSNANLQFVIYLRKEPNDTLPKENSYFRYEVVNGTFAWSQVFLPFNLYVKQQIDIFFAPAHYIPRFCPVPIVVTLHDLAYIYFPQEFLKKDLYKLNHWTEYSVKRACRVIAVSKNTASDAIQQYKPIQGKLEIVPNGFRASLDTKGKTASLPIEVKKPYILFVGTLQPRKNVTGLLDAFARVSKQHPRLQLIIAGKKGWLYEDIFKQVAALHLEKRIIFTGFASDAVLKALYCNASLLVLPGFYEGFGYPMLEAMYFGCPVVASNTGAIPEIGEDAALYFDPKNSFDMAAVMQRVLNNATIQKRLIKKGKEQVLKFNWEKCAKATLEVIKKCLVKK